MADSDKTVRDAMLDTVLNQIETGDPPEAKSTYERLMASVSFSMPPTSKAEDCIR